MITIYHNPACGTSRNVLAAIKERGLEPKIIEYLKTPLSAEEIKALLAKLGLNARGLLREKGTPYAELGLDSPAFSEEQLIDYMVQHPILIQRPVVVTNKGAKICRPSEKVLELLD